jgi:cyanophycin synthetase
LRLSDRCLQKGDKTAPDYVQLILRESTIDTAVLETPVEGILRSGLGYHYAEVGIVLNLHGRDIEIDYAQDLEDVAYAKSVVAEQVYDSGAAVLNADSELIMEMADRARGKIVLFSRDENNPRMRSHILQGGLAAALEGDHLSIWDGAERVSVIQIPAVPLLATLPEIYGLDVLLASAAALYAFGLTPAQIRLGFAQYH